MPMLESEDAGKTALAASILQVDRRWKKLKSRRPFEWVQRKISPKEAEQIKALQLPGIAFLKENQRFYPNSQLAAHLVGFVGLDSKGLEGIESHYDALLNGENQIWTAARDALGREIAMGKGPFEKEDHYRNIVLTIDKPIQHVTERSSVEGSRNGSKRGMAVAMDPSGKILWPPSHV
jgi:cell division protein FtsI (penicillin-binding protein 3)